jgi:hypothetical protein
MAIAAAWSRGRLLSGPGWRKLKTKYTGGLNHECIEQGTGIVLYAVKRGAVVQTEPTGKAQCAEQ